MQNANEQHKVIGMSFERILSLKPGLQARLEQLDAQNNLDHERCIEKRYIELQLDFIKCAEETPFLGIGEQIDDDVVYGPWGGPGEISFMVGGDFRPTEMGYDILEDGAPYLKGRAQDSAGRVIDFVVRPTMACCFEGYSRNEILGFVRPMNFLAAYSPMNFSAAYRDGEGSEGLWYVAEHLEELDYFVVPDPYFNMRYIPVGAAEED